MSIPIILKPKEPNIEWEIFFPIIFPKDSQPQTLEFDCSNEFKFTRYYNNIFTVDNIQYIFAIYYSKFKREKNRKKEVILSLNNKYTINMTLKSKITFVFNATIDEKKNN